MEQPLDLYNCIHMGRRFFFFSELAFVDLLEPLAPSMLAEKGVRLVTLKSGYKKDFPYKICICTIRNRDAKAFMDVMEDLERRILLLGHKDYTDQCKFLLHDIFQEDPDGAGQT